MDHQVPPMILAKFTFSQFDLICEPWVYRQIIMDGSKQDSDGHYVTLTLNINMEKKYKCAEKSGAAGKNICNVIAYVKMVLKTVPSADAFEIYCSLST